MTCFTSDAILLRRVEYGDYDYIITFLGKTPGKISVIAKNAKKSIKRFQGALDPFCLMHISCSFLKNRQGALPVLNSADLDNAFGTIRTDPVKTGYASYWVEMLNAHLEERRAQPELYELLLYALDALDSDMIAGEVLNLLFQIRFMSISGFAPSLTRCGKCRTPLNDIQQTGIVFDFQAGSLVCDKCLGSFSRQRLIETGKGMAVTKGTLKQLFWINSNDTAKAGRIRFSGAAVKEGETLLAAFIPCHIGREFKSLAFLRRIREKDDGISKNSGKVGS